MFRTRIEWERLCAEEGAQSYYVRWILDDWDESERITARKGDKMTARELMEMLQKLSDEELELPIHHVDGAYLGSTALVQHLDINPVASIVGPAMIVLS